MTRDPLWSPWPSKVAEESHLYAPGTPGRASQSWASGQIFPLLSNGALSCKRRDACDQALSLSRG